MSDVKPTTERDVCTVQADERALNMGIAARQAGHKLSENPFGDPDSLDMPVSLSACSRSVGAPAGATRISAFAIADRLEKDPSPAIPKKTIDIQE